MGNLPERQNNKVPGSGLTLSNQAIGLVKAVGAVNDLVAFPLDREAVLHWGLEVERLAPDTEPEKLAFLMDCYKTEKLYWDKQKGIQNIFSGLKWIKKTEKGYTLLQAIW